MKKNIFIIIALIGFVGLFSNCEKDGDKITINDNIGAPQLTTIPSAAELLLKRDNADDTLTFVGTKVNAGFSTSATYILEVCAKGNNFEDAIELYSGDQDASIEITVGKLNSLLLQKFPEDELSSMDFRIRATLTQDAGTGVDPIVSSSTAVNADVNVYGLPALYVTGDANDQRLVSVPNDGIYIGWMQTDGTAFTLTNRDDGTVYGMTGGAIAAGGDPIAIGTGIRYVIVNLNNNTIDISDDEYWGIIGSAIPPYDWTVDVNMTFNIEDQSWDVTGDFVKGEFKFRAFDDWALNLGDTGADGSLNEGGDNIALGSDGNYTIKLLNKTSFSVSKN